MKQNTQNGTYIIRIHKNKIKQKHTKHSTIYTIIYIISYHVIYHTFMISKVLRAVHMTPCNWLTSQHFEETSCFPSARYKLKTGQFRGKVVQREPLILKKRVCADGRSGEEEQVRRRRRKKLRERRWKRRGGRENGQDVNEVRGYEVLKWSRAPKMKEF